MLGLIVRPRYIELILSGKKRWEVRKRRTNVRGTIGLVWGGKLWGFVDIVDVVELPVEEMARREEHGVSPEEIRTYGKGRERLFAWVLEKPRRIEPVEIHVPRGAQVWVRLPAEVERWLRSSEG